MVYEGRASQDFLTITSVKPELARFFAHQQKSNHTERYQWAD